MERPDQIRDRFTKLGDEALKRARDSRWYASSHGIRMAIGSVLKAKETSLGEGERLTLADAVKVVESLRPYCPTLFQNRPGPEQPPVDLSKWKDETSGQMPPNPYSKQTFSITEQGWLEQNEPRLAAYLKATAEKGLSYKFVAEQQAEKQRREALRDLVYSSEEHKSNVFRGRDLTLQSGFRKTLGNDVADFYKAEAETEVSLPWLGASPSLTLTSKMAKEAPLLHALVKSSTEIAKEWGEGLLEQAKAQQVSAETLLKMAVGRPLREVA